MTPDELFFKRVRELGGFFFEEPAKPRRAFAGLIELAHEGLALVEAKDGLLAPDAPAPKQPEPDHETVIRQAPEAQPKNLQACAAGSHRFGEFDPDVGGHVCPDCGLVWTRRA